MADAHNSISRLMMAWITWANKPMGILFCSCNGLARCAYDEGHKMMEAIKADWDKLRDEAYEKWYNDPAVVEQDEQAHSLLDKVKAWEAQFKKPLKADEQQLDMTKDKIAGKPRPKGARPIKTWTTWDCRGAALIRDEAIFRGVAEVEIERRFFENIFREIRARRD